LPSFFEEKRDALFQITELLSLTYFSAPASGRKAVRGLRRRFSVGAKLDRFMN
jgi:hypothetical protein